MNKKIIPDVKYPFDSRRYKVIKWSCKYLQATTILDAIAATLMVITMALAYSTHPNAVIVLSLFYILTIAIRAFIVLRKRRSLDKLRRTAIHQFFHDMDHKLFGDQVNHRFTLFTVDPVNNKYITPYVRFSVGGIDGIKDAEQSKSRYLKGTGYTGMAWKEPRNYHFCTFPEFKDRGEFEYYYTHELKIPEDIVKEISDYMVNVRQIFCYGFVDSKDQFLGALSLDSCIEWRYTPDEMPLLNDILGTLRALLESILKSR